MPTGLSTISPGNGGGGGGGFQVQNKSLAPAFFAVSAGANIHFKQKSVGRSSVQLFV